MASYKSLRAVALALGMALCWHSSRAETSVFVSPSTVNVSPSGSVTLDVMISNASEVRAASVTVTFSNAVLCYSSAEGGLFLASPDPNNKNIPRFSTFFWATTPGPTVNTVTADQAILGPGAVDGTGVLFTLELTALQVGRSAVTISAVDLIDADNLRIPSTTQPGEVIVETPVPVQLVSFTGRLVASRSVLLEWKTLSETNNYGFEVQRSAGQGAEYGTIVGSFVTGHGSTIVPHTYSYVDLSPAIGTWYYRLKQIDLDGTTHYSDGIHVDITTDVKEQVPTDFALYQNYPNPFNPTTEIKFSVASTGRAVLQVYNVLGEEVKVLFDEVAEAGRYHSVRFDAGSLASGIYLFRLQSGNRTDIKKMILVR